MKWNVTHGLCPRGQKRPPLYARWRSMRARCQNPNHHAYANYGGRGIKVCERWESFINYMTDIEALGPPPTPEHRTLDRIDNDGDYEPGNVQWATYADNLLNRRSFKRRGRFSTPEGT